MECIHKKFYMAVVYASISYLTCRLIWADLTRLQGTFLGSWLFIGDFNELLGEHKKRGHRPPPSLSCGHFLS